MQQARLDVMRFDDPNPTEPTRPAPEARAAACPGRESELATLTQLARSIQREQLVLVEGPRGIGKTRLLHEFRGRVRLDGGVVLEGRCEPGRAFGPFAEVVERALRFLDELGQAPRTDLEGLGCGTGCHRLWHQHTDGDPMALRASDPSGASPETAAFERRMRFFDAIASLLREVASIRPPVLLVHHLERADVGTLELLQFLIDGASIGGLPVRALFVGTVCSGDTPIERERLDALREVSSTTRMALGPLDVAGLRAFLTSDETVSRILARTGGHPERLDLLLEAEPLTPRARVQRRIDALGDTGKRQLFALAVLGRPAPLDAVNAVAGLGAETRSEVSGCDLVSRTILEGEVRLGFEREALREEVYDLVESDVRRAMHARAVEVCAGSFAREEAVRHALSTGDVSLACGLGRAAAASLSARHAHHEAAALLESLVEASQPSPRELREELVELYRIAGNYRKALVHARALVDESPDALAVHRVGSLHLLAGDLEPAHRELLQALSLACDEGHAALAVEVEAQLSELLYRRGQYTEARERAERALERASARDDARVEVHARNILGKLALAQKDPEHAAKLFDRNRAQANHTGLAHQEAQALTNLAIAHFLRNDFVSAEEHCRRAIDLATLASDTRDRAIATENLAVLAHLRRDYTRALQHYHTAVGLLKRLGNRAMLVRLATNLGELYLSLGDRERARSFCDQAAHVAGAGTPPPVTAERLALRGRIEAAERHSEAARAAFEGALEIFDRLGDVRSVDVRLELARVAIDDGDVASARRLVALVPPQEGKRAAQLALATALLEQALGGDAVDAAEAAVGAAESTGDDERLLPALLLAARVYFDSDEFGHATRMIERASEADERLSRSVPEDASALWAARPARTELVALQARIASASPRVRESVPPRRERSERFDRRFPAIAGSAPALQQVLSIVEKVASHDTIVLIRGESGTGKELIAEAIHHNSPRASKALVKVNCAALVETLLLSELFGHERGAFTGAQARKKGRFELADGGTIFLDEIGDISAKTQVALLRVLQEREFERVGGTQPIRVDVRIVAATHRDLERMVREGTFREDLYYRLRGVTLEMPPLRRRLEDLPVLTEQLLARIATERQEPAKRIAPATLELLAQHRWPGNVRELENVLRSATLFAEGDTLEPADMSAFAETFLPAEPRSNPGLTLGVTDLEHLAYERVRQGATSLFEMKKNLERECIVRALEETGGNITRAAALLGMKRPRLSQLVKEYELGDLGK